MGIKLTNNAFGTLAAGINSSATSITLTTGQGARFPTLSAGDYFYATLIDTSNNLEIVKCTARSTDVLTVVRAQETTTARAYSTGDRIEIRLTAATFIDALDPIEALGYTPVNKAGDTMTGGLSATSLSTTGQLSMSGGGDMSLNRTDGFDMSIVMPSNMDNKALYFQRAGGGKINQVRFNTNTTFVDGSLESATRSVAGFNQANSMPDSMAVGSWLGHKTYLLGVENATPSGTTKLVIQRSTDWNDWVNDGMLITFQANLHSGGGLYSYYWRLGYGTNTLIPLFGGGESIPSGNITINGPYQVSGAPSDCKYFELSISQGAYMYTHMMVNTNLSPVSSITYYGQVRLRNG